MRYYSLANGLCIIAENLSIAALLWLDFDIMAVAFSKLVFAGMWLVLFIRLPKSGFGMSWQPAVIKTLFGNSTSILGTELAKAGRHHADTWIAGRILTPELFGIYAFAKNAGVGFGQCLSCRHNLKLADGKFQCGLTGERLLEPEVKLICREHEFDPAPGTSGE